MLRASFFLPCLVLALAAHAVGCTSKRDSAARASGDAAIVDPVCGKLPCELFPTPAAAFARVLADEPRVLAIGETHAREGVDAKSTARRFVDEFLPLVDGKASDLVVELWVAKSGCTTRQKAEVRAVASVQREVTHGQSPKNASDFLALYTAGRAHGLHVRILVPPCDEYAKILDAGLGDVDAMLTMIADRSAAEISEGLAAPGSKMIVAYGGAMHNDLVPRPGHAKWSFGPRASVAAQGHYVELDLVVPEAVRDTEAWRAQPWYEHFRKGAQGEKTLLYRVRPGSYALVFPEERSTPGDGGTDRTSDGSVCLLYTSPSPRDRTRSRMPSSA